MRRSACVALTALATLTAPASVARADEVIATVTRPTPVSAFDGRILWSQYDAAANAYFLTQRFGPVTARLPVKPRSVPFDVDVGRNAGNQTVAAYSRCRRDPAPRDPRTGNALAQMPQWSTGRGCDVYMLNLQTNVEIRLGGASSSRASEFLPAVWRGRIAFARVYQRRRGAAGERAYLYFHSLTRGGSSRRLIAGSRARDRYCTGKPARCRRLIEPGPTAIDLSGRYMTFGWDSTSGGPTSAIYFEKLRAGHITRREASRTGSGEIQAQELLPAGIDSEAHIVWIRSLFGDSTGSEVKRYYVLNGNRDLARLQPVPGQPFVYTVLAGGVDGTTPLYLASGRAPIGEPCTAQAPCLVEPGCADLQPCELRRATDLTFPPPTRD
jgi:hypothetical protein